MLQQTRVETALPYFGRWMSRFPSIKTLAAASETAVLGMWEGLGYYSRARNLQRAARLIVREFDGRVPSEIEDLRRLPGVGAYTAGAIASIAFGKDVCVLDANIRRVFARVFLARVAAHSRAGDALLLDLAVEHLPRGRAGDFNQALMDLGSAVCLSRSPRCGVCPIDDLCKARKRGMQEHLPIRSLTRGTPHVVFGAVVVTRRGRVLMIRRPSTGLLGGLWEFPKTELGPETHDPRGPSERLTEALLDTYSFSVLSPSPLGIVHHAYSHFRITVHAFSCKTRSAVRQDRFRWVALNRLARYPMGRVDRRIAEWVQP
jgi:A/G-specific adenine glycosylase